jgi:type IV secretory pathway VirB10-like protein
LLTKSERNKKPPFGGFFVLLGVYFLYMKNIQAPETIPNWELEPMPKEEKETNPLTPEALDAKYITTPAQGPLAKDLENARKIEEALTRQPQMAVNQAEQKVTRDSSFGQTNLEDVASKRRDFEYAESKFSREKTDALYPTALLSAAAVGGVTASIMGVGMGSAMLVAAPVVLAAGATIGAGYYLAKLGSAWFNKNKKEKELRLAERSS